MSRFNGEGYHDPVPRKAARNMEHRAWRPLVYVASPYAGDTESNARNAVRYCRFAFEHGAIPFAPHLFLPRFISEETEREEVMFMNRVFLGKCDELWVFGPRITDGMAEEIRWAERRGTQIRHFTEDCVETMNGGL
ncbi:MAG: DUF4406 domain-containing protein [Schwartzia sp.]|nr:DUF4406 domain-containing protein [Schwartzia sp. (in: firmicutes)]